MPDKPNTERPQRIELPNGYYLEKIAHGWTIKHGKTDLLKYGYFSPNTGERFAAAMASQDGLREALEAIMFKASSYYMSVSDEVASPRGINAALKFIIDTAQKALAASPPAQHEAMAPAGKLNLFDNIPNGKNNPHYLTAIRNQTLGLVLSKNQPKAPAMTTKSQSDADVAREYFDSLGLDPVKVEEYALDMAPYIAQHVAARTKPLVEALETIRRGIMEGYLQDLPMSNGYNLSEVVGQALALAQEKGKGDANQ